MFFAGKKKSYANQHFILPCHYNNLLHVQKNLKNICQLITAILKVITVVKLSLMNNQFFVYEHNVEIMKCMKQSSV